MKPSNVIMVTKFVMPSFFVQIHVFQLYHKFLDLVLETKTTRYNNFVRSISNTLELTLTGNLNESYAEYVKIDDNCVRMSQMLLYLVISQQ